MSVRTGMFPPPSVGPAASGMPGPMPPMGAAPNPFAPMPPMPLAGMPSPPPMGGMPPPPMPQAPMPQPSSAGLGSVAGSNAPRRRMFGDFLESKLGGGQARPAPQMARPPQMQQQQRMVAPGTPAMRTPPMQSMTPRPMEMGGIVAGQPFDMFNPYQVPPSYGSNDNTLYPSMGPIIDDRSSQFSSIPGFENSVSDYNSSPIMDPIVDDISYMAPVSPVMDPIVDNMPYDTVSPIPLSEREMRRQSREENKAEREYARDLEKEERDFDRQQREVERQQRDAMVDSRMLQRQQDRFLPNEFRKLAAQERVQRRMNTRITGDNYLLDNYPTVESYLEAAISKRPRAAEYANTLAVGYNMAQKRNDGAEQRYESKFGAPYQAYEVRSGNALSDGPIGDSSLGRFATPYMDYYRQAQSSPGGLMGFDFASNPFGISAPLQDSAPLQNYQGGSSGLGVPDSPDFYGIQGFNDGGPVQYMEGGGTPANVNQYASNRPNLREFMDSTGADYSAAVDAIYGSVGSNVDVRDWDAIMASNDPLSAAREATRQMYTGGDASSLSTGTGQSSLPNSTGGVSLSDSGYNTGFIGDQIFLLDEKGAPITGLSANRAASFGLTQSDINQALTAAGVDMDSEYARRFQNKGYDMQDYGSLLVDYSDLERGRPVVNAGSNNAGSSSSGGSYDAVSQPVNVSDGIDYSQFNGDVGKFSNTGENFALYGPQIDIPSFSSQYISSPGMSGLTTTNGPDMTAVSGIGALNMPASPVDLDVLNWLSEPTYGSLDRPVEEMEDGGAVPRQTMIGDDPHMLAYINPEEAQLLKDLGGTGEPGPGGIPAYRPSDFAAERTGTGAYSSYSHATDGDDDNDNNTSAAVAAANAEAAASMLSAGVGSVGGTNYNPTANDDDNDRNVVSKYVDNETSALDDFADQQYNASFGSDGVIPGSVADNLVGAQNTNLGSLHSDNNTLSAVVDYNTNANNQNVGNTNVTTLTDSQLSNASADTQGATAAEILMDQQAAAAAEAQAQAAAAARAAAAAEAAKKAASASWFNSLPEPQFTSTFPGSGDSDSDSVSATINAPNSIFDLPPPAGLPPASSDVGATDDDLATDYTKIAGVNVGATDDDLATDFSIFDTEADEDPLSLTAAEFRANEDAMSQGLGAPDNSTISDVIKGFEGYSKDSYYDVNANRAGYGSDTKTDPETGKVTKITKDTNVSKAEADADLERRLQTEFIPNVVNKIGADTFYTMTPSQQAALTSITYNYGSLPDRVASVVKNVDPSTAEGQAAISAAISSLGADNDGINKNRREQEAALFSGTGSANKVQDLTPGQNAARTVTEEAIRATNPGASDDEITKIKAQLDASVPVQGFGKFMANIGKGLFYGLGEGFIQGLVDKTEAERANIVDMHMNAINNGATPKYDDDGKYIGYDNSTTATFGQKVLNYSQDNDISALLPPSLEGGDFKITQADIDEINRINKMYEGDQAKIGEGLAAGDTITLGSFTNDNAIDSGNARFQQVYDAQSKAAELDPYGMSTENGFITSDGQEFIVTLDGKLVKVEDGVVGTGESILNSGLGVGTEIATIFGDGDDTHVTSGDDDATTTTDESGNKICDKEGYVYDPVEDKCVPAVAEEESTDTSLNIGSGASRSFEDVLKNIQTKPTTIAPISANIKPMAMGGMAGLNRTADNFLRALGG